MASKKSGNSSRVSTSRTRRPEILDLLGSMQQGRQQPSHPGAANDVQKISGFDRTTTKSIDFGKAPSAGGGSGSSRSGSEWETLLKSAGSSASHLLSGGGILSFGISSLFSGLSSLFGGTGKSEPAPLKQFALSESQDTTAYLSGGVLSTESAPSRPLKNAGGIYGKPASVASQADIVKTVKNALLTSSSLNDIISEL